MRSHEEMVKDIFFAALRAVDSYASVKQYAGEVLKAYREGDFRRLIVAGFGKASAQMAKALEDSLGDMIDDGIVITKYDHCPRSFTPKKIRVIEAAHPVPDENGTKGTEEIIGLLKGADEKTLVVLIISGGGSALLAAPSQGISLNDKQIVTQMLLRAGASIHELNAVRKHISRVKGGRLAGIAWPARVISLIISDVIGDDLDVIASGPASPDGTTYNDAYRVLQKYHLTDRLPQSVMEVFRQGMNGHLADTPKGNDPVFANVRNIIISSSKKALQAAKEAAESFGYRTDIVSSDISGEAREAAKMLAAMACDRKKAVFGAGGGGVCMISGGETTVVVRGNGLGGRNTELALAFAMEIDGTEGITLLSAGTDGTDGPTDAAGAIVDGSTIRRARSLGLDPADHLQRNDSYNFFRETGGLLITGATGTNVMDVQVILVGQSRV